MFTQDPQGITAQNLPREQYNLGNRLFYDIPRGWNRSEIKTSGVEEI